MIPTHRLLTTITPIAVIPPPPHPPFLDPHITSFSAHYLCLALSCAYRFARHSLVWLYQAVCYIMELVIDSKGFRIIRVLCVG